MSINQQQGVRYQTTKRIFNQCLISILAILLLAPSTKASVIEYTTRNVNGGTWEYSYYLSGLNFMQFGGFQIYFDYNFYSDLDNFPVAPNTDWSPITFNPDPSLFINSLYDAIALVNNPSLTDPFVISFNWSGVDQPAAQGFSLYQCEDEFCSTGVTFGRTGTTVARNDGGGPNPNPIPEPLTTLLIGLGLLGMAFVRQSRYAFVGGNQHMD